MEKYYKNWLNNLSEDERQCFKRYRNKLDTMNNQNGQLRKGTASENLIIMSKTLNKACTPDNILIFRVVAKKENEVLLKLKPQGK